MRTALQIISWLALAATIGPSVAYFLGAIDLDRMKLAMLIATVVWFVVTPSWMGRRPKDWETRAPVAWVPPRSPTDHTR